MRGLIKKEQEREIKKREKKKAENFPLLQNSSSSQAFHVMYKVPKCLNITCFSIYPPSTLVGGSGDDDDSPFIFGGSCL